MKKNFSDLTEVEICTNHCRIPDKCREDSEDCVRRLFNSAKRKSDSRKLGSDESGWIVFRGMRYATIREFAKHQVAEGNTTISISGIISRMQNKGATPEEAIDPLYGKKSSVTYEGKVYKSEYAFCKYLSEVSGISISTLRNRIKAGWSVERAISLAPSPKGQEKCL